MEENYKNVSNIKVSKECFKRLKILSIDKDIPLNKLVADILEQSVSKKGKLNIQEE